MRVLTYETRAQMGAVGEENTACALALHSLAFDAPDC
jgi:hypothetical protein